ncbi:MAG: ATP synthase F1 subunit epsilon [Oscillospiraceae bacterium]|jgi:F-type H+-transporting ATPase subunit epsilon|nr:ATP synthase F1 subunit epsilon [Oscillospiraceae bacterium]
MSAFHLTILTPEHTFFEGAADSLTFQTDDGLFGVLAGHQPEVVTLAEGMIRISSNGSIREAAGSDGFVTILPGNVTVILQSIEWPEDIDRHRAEEAKREAEEALRQRQSLREYTLARSMLARAMVRLRVSDQNRG